LHFYAFTVLVNIIQQVHKVELLTVIYLCEVPGGKGCKNHL